MKSLCLEKYWVKKTRQMCNKGIKKTRQIHVKGTIWLACSRWNGGGEDSVDRLLFPQEKISTFSIDIFPHSQNNFSDNQRIGFKWYRIHTYPSSVAFPKQFFWWSICGASYEKPVPSVAWQWHVLKRDTIFSALRIIVIDSFTLYWIGACQHVSSQTL